MRFRDYKSNSVQNQVTGKSDSTGSTSRIKASAVKTIGDSTGDKNRIERAGEIVGGLGAVGFAAGLFVAVKYAGPWSDAAVIAGGLPDTAMLLSGVAMKLFSKPIERMVRRAGSKASSVITGSGDDGRKQAEGAIDKWMQETMPLMKTVRKIAIPAGTWELIVPFGIPSFGSLVYNVQYAFSKSSVEAVLLDAAPCVSAAAVSVGYALYKRMKRI